MQSRSEEAEGAEAARDQAQPDHDARPERDDDRRPRARHVVQARGRRLPHGAAAADDPRGRADRDVLHDVRLLRRRAAEREAGSAAAEGGSVRTRSSSACRRRSRRSRSRPATRSPSSVGASFGGEIVNPQAHIVPTPVHSRLRSATIPGYTLELAAAGRAKVPFRFHAPRHVVQSNSNATSLEPVRVFQPRRTSTSSRSPTSPARATSTGTSSRPTGPTRRSSGTRPMSTRSPAASSTSSRPAATSTWSCSARAARATGS